MNQEKLTVTLKIMKETHRKIKVLAAEQGKNISEKYESLLGVGLEEESRKKTC